MAVENGGGLAAFHAETERIAALKPRRRLAVPSGHILVGVDLELTPNQEAFLRRVAAVEFPLAPTGKPYLGKAATIIYRLGVELMRQRWEDSFRDSMEDLYGCISEDEAAESRLSIVDNLDDTRGISGDMGD